MICTHGKDTDGEPVRESANKWVQKRRGKKSDGKGQGTNEIKAWAVEGKEAMTSAAVFLSHPPFFYDLCFCLSESFVTYVRAFGLCVQEFILNQDWNDPKSQLQQCCLTLRTEGKEPDIPLYK